MPFTAWKVSIGNVQKEIETDTEKEKYIYYDFIRFGDYPTSSSSKKPPLEPNFIILKRP